MPVSHLLINSKYKRAHFVPNMNNIDPKILEKLYRYCAYRDRCTFEVSEKLRKLQVPNSLHRSYLEELEDQDFLDDDRFTESFIRGKLRFKKWGKIKIRAKLLEKRISDDMITRYLNAIDEQDYFKTLQLLLSEKSQRTSKSDLELRDHLYRYGISKGFESNLVVKALGEMYSDLNA